MKNLKDMLSLGKKIIKPVAKPLVLSLAVLFGSTLLNKANAQTPEWYQAFQPRNEVVDGFNSYGIPDLNNNKNLKDDLNLILGSTDPKADIDGDGDRGTEKDVEVYTEYINGDRNYLPGEFWRLTPSEKEDWVRKVYPIMTEMNNYTFNSSADPDEFFDSDRFSVGDFLTGNGYNSERDDFNLIHEKYNLDYNGLFNLPIYIARVHSDDGTFNHGFSVVNKGPSLNDPNSWIFLEPQLGELVEPGSYSIPYNSKILIYGVKNFKDSNISDLPRLTVATELYIDSQGNRSVTYINPNMVVDQTELAAEDENTSYSKPPEFSLDQNYPNPFNSVTNIKYKIPERSYVRLDVYEMNGEKVKSLEQGVKEPGRYKIVLDLNKQPSGIYYYSLLLDGRLVINKNMTLLK